MDRIKLAAVLAEYPGCAGFLACCADRGDDETAIRTKIARDEARRDLWDAFFRKVAQRVVADGVPEIVGTPKPPPTQPPPVKPLSPLNQQLTAAGNNPANAGVNPGLNAQGLNPQVMKPPALRPPAVSRPPAAATAPAGPPSRIQGNRVVPNAEDELAHYRALAQSRGNLIQTLPGAADQPNLRVGQMGPGGQRYLGMRSFQPAGGQPAQRIPAYDDPVPTDLAEQANFNNEDFRRVTPRNMTPEEQKVWNTQSQQRAQLRNVQQDTHDQNWWAQLGGDPETGMPGDLSVARVNQGMKYQAKAQNESATRLRAAGVPEAEIPGRVAEEVAKARSGWAPEHDGAGAAYGRMGKAIPEAMGAFNAMPYAMGFDAIQAAMGQDPSGQGPLGHTIGAAMDVVSPLTKGLGVNPWQTGGRQGLWDINRGYQAKLTNTAETSPDAGVRVGANAANILSQAAPWVFASRGFGNTHMGGLPGLTPAQPMNLLGRLATTGALPGSAIAGAGVGLVNEGARIMAPQGDDPSKPGGGAGAVQPAQSDPAQQQPGGAPGAQPGAAPGAPPGAAPAPQPGAQPGAAPAPQPGAQPGAAPPLPPLETIDAKSLAAMTPQEAQARGVQADQRASAFLEQAKTMDAEQLKAAGPEIKGIVTDRITAYAKANNADPAALLAKAQEGGFTPDDLNMSMQSPAGQDFMQRVSAAGKDPWGTFQGMEGWQQALLVAGVPLALMGIGQSIFGGQGSGMMGMLMSLLGVGMGAGALGAFGENGPFGGIGKQFAGVGNDVMGLLGMNEGGGAAAKPAAPAAAAPAGGKFQIPQFYWNAKPEDRQSMLQMLFQQKPELRQQIESGMQSYDRGKNLHDTQVFGAKPLGKVMDWLGYNPDDMAAAKAQEFGISPGQLRQLMQDYQPLRGG